MRDNEPVLRRALTLGPVVLFGLAYMTPLIVLGIFGIVAEATGGAAASAYALALVAMIFTALSYGRMAAVYPTAGSAYTYARRTIDARVGFLVGWAVLLDYLFLPMVIWLIGGSYLSAQFPGVPQWVWIVAFIVVTTVLNLLGIKVAAGVNSLLMTFQILVLIFFVLLSVGYLAGSYGPEAMLGAAPFANPDTTVPGIAAGAAIAAYSFLGFDAVTTLTEETVEPTRTIPRAIVLTALIGGAIFILVAYTTQLVHPGGFFRDSSSAAFDIARTIAGSLFGAVFLAGLVIAQFTSGLAAQASTSRLLYAMGRDAVLPRRVFGYVHRRYRTPAFGIVLTGAVGLVALRLDVAVSTSFINFGAFTAFTFVNISVIAFYVHERHAGRPLGVVAYVLVPAAGAAVDLWLLTRLDAQAVTLGLIWLGAGLLYLAYLTRLFRLPPPEMGFEEGAPVVAEGEPRLPG
ncbi:amino acid transporter [Streptosporangium becharense]|uniref:Amino acid transporter n=1 Tax=Streptosporangium becharense TaxID=1816182 RepID=A0A7W9MJI3_9ACTN|nr:APC family permease [Streptosporangium becharense]MBB2910514.1 amino acid transporter [Streptosporangium becharense]MBB5823257.1 amino acid transporter [Streptosporangium becharense]